MVAVVYGAIIALVLYAVTMDKATLPSGSGQGPRVVSVEEFRAMFIAAYSRVDAHSIPWELAYAVASLETNHGNGNVFQHSNNLFSILCSSAWKGDCYQGRPNSLTANPLGDSHRVYSTLEASVADWVRLMQTAHYHGAYEAALRNNSTDFFMELQRAGYAGINQQYAQGLRRVYTGEMV